MTERSRREFLETAAVAVGSALVAGGLTRAAGPVATGAAPDGARPLPPSGRFLDAVTRGNVPEVARMLERDPGLLHARDSSGRSAFALALIHGHADVAALLRERGHAPDLHESALALDWERFEQLAEPAPGAANQDHPIGGTAMYAAALGGAGSQIWRVYRFGCDPNRRPGGESERTPLCAALELDDLAVAEMTAATLLANGADPALPEADGRSPLHVAAARGSSELVEMLLRKGAPSDRTDADGRLPIDLANLHGHSDVAALLERGVPRDHSTSRTAFDVDGEPYRAPDLSAFAPVARERVVGASHFDLEYVREAVTRHPLLAHAVATTTEITVEACAHTGRREIVDFLLERGAPYSLLTAVMRGDLARSRALLDQDPLRIHERGPHDFALLWYPIIGDGGVDAAKLLLERGAQVERQHHLGTTALHWAAMAGRTEMIELLLDNGADIDRVGRKFDASGQTPLELARARGRDAAARLLRDRGAGG